MYKNCCKKCGSIDIYIKESGDNTGLYCSDCGAWIKWLSKDELRAFKHSVEEKESIKTSVVLDDKKMELYEASLPLLAFMNKYYCPMDKAILTEGRIEIVCGDMGMPLPIRD